jgi:RNA-directed DNA polymerase
MEGSDRRERSFDTAESETLGMCGNSMGENREALQTPTLDGVGRSKKAKGRNVDMHVCGESDGLVVPTKRANKADAYGLAAESAEGRRATKGNASQAHSRRTQSRGMRVTGFVARTTSCKKGKGYSIRIPTSGWPSYEPEVRAV